MLEETSENAESVESNDNPITVDAIKAVRRATSEEMWVCKLMLMKYDGDVDKVIEELKKQPARQQPLMGRIIDNKKEDK